MPSAKQVIAVRLDDETYQRIEILATENSRSVANMTEVLIRNSLELEHWHKNIVPKKTRPAKKK